MRKGRGLPALPLAARSRPVRRASYQARRPRRTPPASCAGWSRRTSCTFDGKPLFPERVAQTVPYELTAAEQDLYEQVTTYVRDEMNRAAASSTASAATTVGFALTVLQRRLASSPEAIYQSLGRRVRSPGASSSQEVLDRRHRGRRAEPADDSVARRIDETSSQPTSSSTIEEELVDAATAARTVEELEAELLVLRRSRSRPLAGARPRTQTGNGLSCARSSRTTSLGQDDAGDAPRKLIVFTEHRDTLDYLHAQDRLAARPARSGAARSTAACGAASAAQVTEEFTHNPDCQILLATDAAGEGLNLQVAHLMVNYDLPWNPNRIEQRFGRIHRIGQPRSADCGTSSPQDTREGDVFTRLLEKLEEQRKAYGGKVFDVLGAAFDEQPLRELLLEAIRYGEQPEVRARMEQVIDERVSEGLAELLAEHALARECACRGRPRRRCARQMEEARARRLQPHFIEDCFLAAFREPRWAGSARREPGRFRDLATSRRDFARLRSGPVAYARYDRVTFDLDRDRRRPNRASRADRARTPSARHRSRRSASALAGTFSSAGAVLVSSTVSESAAARRRPRAGRRRGRRDPCKAIRLRVRHAAGRVRPAGPAPYLDCVAAPPGADAAQAARSPGWRRRAPRWTGWSPTSCPATWPRSALEGTPRWPGRGLRSPCG